MENVNNGQNLIVKNVFSTKQMQKMISTIQRRKNNKNISVSIIYHSNEPKFV